MEQHNPRTLTELLDILVKIFSPEALDDIKYCRTLGELPSLDRFIRKNLVIQNDNRCDLYADCSQETPRDVAQMGILMLQERLRKGVLAQG